MIISLLLIGVTVAVALSLVFSTLTYSLREFSRPKLQDAFEIRGKAHFFEPTVDHASDLVFATAVGRLLSNILILIGVLSVLYFSGHSLGVQYLLAVLITAVLHLFFSVAIPHAISRHAAEPTIASCVGFLRGLRLALLPVTKLMHVTDRVVASAAAGPADEQSGTMEEEIENEILSVVEEGQKEGVVNEDERRMIERVIAFHDTHVGQIMTPRPEIFALDVGATLETVKAKITQSGHSRIPVYQTNIDQIVGILHARDLLKYLGQPPERFSLNQFMRPAFFVPETKPLRDLLRDFRLQKVHIAIVSDEYGGTAGLITIEDIFEELVGDISDEHEPTEPAMIVRTSDRVAEADARIYLDELNRILGLNLPEEEGYDTLGGFVVNTLGRIPTPGTQFDHAGVKYTVLDAEPQKVNRVKLELTPQDAAEAAPAAQEARP
jgi:putative hemolysin